MRVRPCFSGWSRPADTSTCRCRVVVGQACLNIDAMAPAVISPPSKFKVSRMRRRAGWARAVNTAS